ncbi:MAG: hypothetical protein AAGA73_05355 [Pseudomonadota bacterium]
MHRVKSTVFTAVGMIIALASLGFFATLGLGIVGVLVLLGVTGATAAGIAGLLERSRHCASAFSTELYAR